MLYANDIFGICNSGKLMLLYLLLLVALIVIALRSFSIGATRVFYLRRGQNRQNC